MIFKYIVAFFVIESLLMVALQYDIVITNNLLIFLLGFWVANIEEKRGGSND